MWRIGSSSVLLSLFLLNGGAASAQEAVSTAVAPRSSAFMRIYGQVDPPSGYVGFCRREPALCRAQQIRASGRMQLTPERWRDLVEVNSVVNRTVVAESDQDLYGLSEFWTLPHNRGDCEDYALLKQRLLVQRGWSASDLLMTVVRDEDGNGHAVLTARTSDGDFILDNRVAEVKPWQNVPYGFVKRQSYLNPTIWVSLEPITAAASRQISASTRSE